MLCMISCWFILLLKTQCRWIALWYRRWTPGTLYSMADCNIPEDSSILYQNVIYPSQTVYIRVV